MGSYKEIKGDLLDLFDNQTFNVIMHGANCFNTMGSGIAKQIKERYLSAYIADVTSNMKTWEKLGQFTWTYFSASYQLLINLYTQYQPGPNADLTAIRMSIKKVVLSELIKETDRIGLPLIGCGIGGLKWEDVKPIIQEELKDFDVTVVIYDKN